MRHLVLMSAVALAISPVASAPVFAQATPQNAQSAQKASTETQNPNEIVCEKQRETGSRLASQKVCMTRAQWAEQRRLNRMDVDKMQTQRGCNSGSGC